MKLYLIKLPMIFNSNSSMSLTYELTRKLFTTGKWYDGQECPTIINPVTLQPDPVSYIVKCDDGNFRKVYGVCFLTQEEWREMQLNKIL